MTEAHTFVITAADIEACLIHSMSVTHYYPDGTCRCNEEAPPPPPEGSEPPEGEEPPDEDHYWVDGYTREDGTEVAGYWRRNA